MAEKKTDVFPQLAYLSVTESAANTLTFARLDIATGALLGEKKYGMVIHRVQYGIPLATRQLMVANGDQLQVALCVSPNIATIDLNSPEVIDNVTLARWDAGTAASAIVDEMQIIHDFSMFGGLLVPADKLYIAAKSLSVASAGIYTARVWYTMKELTIADYWDLVETRRIIST